MKNSNREEKLHAPLELFSNFLTIFYDPNPKTNRDILSELLTIGSKEHPYPNDKLYSDTAARLCEAVRELLNGIIENGLTDKIVLSGSYKSETESFKYDYTKLNEFLSKEVIPRILLRDLHYFMEDLLI